MKWSDRTVRTCSGSRLWATITNQLIVRAALEKGLSTASGLVIPIACLHLKKKKKKIKKKLKNPSARKIKNLNM